MFVKEKDEKDYSGVDYKAWRDEFLKLFFFKEFYKREVVKNIDFYVDFVPLERWVIGCNSKMDSIVNEKLQRLKQAFHSNGKEQLIYWIFLKLRSIWFY